MGLGWEMGDGWICRFLLLIRGGGVMDAIDSLNSIRWAALYVQYDLRLRLDTYRFLFISFFLSLRSSSVSAGAEVPVHRIHTYVSPHLPTTPASAIVFNQLWERIKRNGTFRYRKLQTYHNRWAPTFPFCLVFVERDCSLTGMEFIQATHQLESHLSYWGSLIIRGYLRTRRVLLSVLIFVWVANRGHITSTGVMITYMICRCVRWMWKGRLWSLVFG